MDSAPPAGQLQPVLESACSTVLSAVMGLRVFWKFSAACKTLLKLRDDASDKGLGCMFLPEVLFPLSERFAVRSLLQHAVKRDDPKPLTQMQKVQGFAVDTFYPGLLAYALEKSACACIDLLTLQRPPPSLPCPGLSAATVGKMDPVTLSILLQRKVLHPDAWFDVEDVWYEGGDGIFFEDASEDGLGKHTLKYHKPLLNVLIDAHNFSGAELVLKVGARTDMYEWRGEEDFKKGDKNHSRNWQTGFHFLGKTPLHSAILTLPPPPLFHLETAGLTSYTCPPFDSQPPAAAAASASAVVGDRPKDSRAKGLELIVSPLVIACHLGNPSLIHLLLERAGADPNRLGVCDDGEAVRRPAKKILSWARYEGVGGQKKCLEMFKILADGGADLEMRVQGTDFPHSLLSLACAYDLREVTEFLLERKVAVNQTRRTGRRKRVALTRSLIVCLLRARGCSAIVELLLDAGADPNVGVVVRLWGVVERFWPLGVAMQRLSRIGSAGNREVEGAAALLIERGARCLFSSRQTVGEGTDGSRLPLSQISPLVVACKIGSERLVRLLVHKAGADPNRRGKYAEWDEGKVLPLEIALVRSSEKTWPVVEALIEYVALFDRYSGGVEALIDAGADVEDRINACMTEGDTEPTRVEPLMFALRSHQWASAEILLDAGADTSYVRAR
uniref:Uncharacterized protein n=1 Tax=Chromera velia CCMP2878 TaxID=1169474 RepID=A0A0K6S7P4_9ALVE|eukprot:Cvel_21739.t2-p1 / transcript=Cvel_21739.t2 / gene=Cvel_21739 / organism=Chromera_velia_CCMP2878 / gene_product=hypothetical protein / transcript_product=hypothetical protein / location=Cvel_scaffold2065:2259-5629(+) / protein_length=672 / sequence_SO=supercontig / SO=protein_coding / is_pseudo=false